MITGLERVPVHALAAELDGRTPFDDVAHHRAIRLRHVDVHEGVRITEQKLYELPLDCDRLVLDIRRCERMMRQHLCADRQRNDCEWNNQITHDDRPLWWSVTKRVAAIVAERAP